MEANPVKMRLNFFNSAVIANSKLDYSKGVVCFIEFSPRVVANLSGTVEPGGSHYGGLCRKSPQVPYFESLVNAYAKFGGGGGGKLGALWEMCKWRVLEILYQMNPNNKSPDLFSRETSLI